MSCSGGLEPRSELKLPGTPAGWLPKDPVAQGSGRGRCPEADLGQLAEQGPLPEEKGEGRQGTQHSQRGREMGLPQGRE